MKTYGVEKQYVDAYKKIKEAMVQTKKKATMNGSRSLYKQIFIATAEKNISRVLSLPHQNVSVAVCAYLDAKRDDVQERWDRRRLRRNLMENINHTTTTTTTTTTRRMKI